MLTNFLKVWWRKESNKMCIKVFELYVKIFFETYLYVNILGRNSGDCSKASLLLIFCTPLVFHRDSRLSKWNTLKYHFSFLTIVKYHLINWEFNNYTLWINKFFRNLQLYFGFEFSPLNFFFKFSQFSISTM